MLLLFFFFPLETYQLSSIEAKGMHIKIYKNKTLILNRTSMAAMQLIFKEFFSDLFIGRDHQCNFMQHLGSTIIHRTPLLKIMKAASEVCEESVNSYLVKPIMILHIWILTKVEMQERVLISVRVWVHLHSAPSTLIVRSYRHWLFRNAMVKK